MTQALAEKRSRGRVAKYVPFIPDKEFSSDSAEARFFGPDAEPINVEPWDSSYDIENADEEHNKKRSLSPDEEKTLFLRYNYARYRHTKLVEEQEKNPTPSRAKQILEWKQRVDSLESDLVTANMPLVVARAKKTPTENIEFADMIAEGNMALMRAVKKFDVSRGFRFSTFACTAINNQFRRVLSYAKTQAGRFPLGLDVASNMDYITKLERVEDESEEIELLRRILSGDIRKLTPLEMLIVNQHNGIGAENGAQTFKQIGMLLDLTQEKIRQHELRAKNKIRAVIRARLMRSII